MTNEVRIGRTGAQRLGWRAARGPGPASVRPATCWDGALTTPVEIMAPDRESASVLAAEAGARFRSELVETAGSAVVVRLRPAGTGSVGWVFELLALVERWLEARCLPVANARYGGRSYLIPAPTADRRWADAVEPLPAA